ncbi:30S ribosomal protein S13 [Candidatus Pacearchaeota archaeon]|nr:30S ribosomal protein S13 [Candidatus Pacearchaeota archaeon]
MADKTKYEPKTKAEKAQQEKELKKRPSPEEDEHETLVRIFGYDIPGSKQVYVGLTRIKGISWSIANAACILLKLPRSKKIVELSKDEIKKIEDFLTKLPVPDFMKNRRKDIETGETSHVYGSTLDMRREFDVKRLKEMKSYKGIRHALRLPVRGQRTRSHFRTKSQASGKRKTG